MIVVPSPFLATRMPVIIVSYLEQGLLVFSKEFISLVRGSSHLKAHESAKNKSNVLTVLLRFPLRIGYMRSQDLLVLLCSAPDFVRERLEFSLQRKSNQLSYSISISN